MINLLIYFVLLSIPIFYVISGHFSLDRDCCNILLPAVNAGKVTLSSVLYYSELIFYYISFFILFLALISDLFSLFNSKYLILLSALIQSLLFLDLTVLWLVDFNDRYMEIRVENGYIIYLIGIILHLILVLFSKSKIQLVTNNLYPRK